jgi:hypothetical protein
MEVEVAGAPPTMGFVRLFRASDLTLASARHERHHAFHRRSPRRFTGPVIWLQGYGFNPLSVAFQGAGSVMPKAQPEACWTTALHPITICAFTTGPDRCPLFCLPIEPNASDGPPTPCRLLCSGASTTKTSCD